jgi:uncharacterized protein (TIGR02147 family)
VTPTKEKNKKSWSVATASPIDFIDYKIYLKRVYQNRKAEQSSYSYKQYAADLGFAAGTLLHQIVQGYRPLTLKTAEKIAEGLELKSSEKRYFFAMIEYAQGKHPIDKDMAFNTMLEIKAETLATEYDQSCLEYFSEWFHPAVRELVAFADFQDDPQWIADTLHPRIRPAQAKKSLELLKKLNLITYDEELKRWVQTSAHLATSAQVRGVAFSKFHQSMIDLGKKSLANTKSVDRNINALTVSVDRRTFEKIKGLMEEFNQRLTEVVDECQHPDSIYQLNMQLFPLSRKPRS